MKKLLIIILAIVGFQYSQAQVSEDFLAQFSTEEVREFVREFVREYEEFIEDYIEALKEKDDAKLQELAKGVSSFATMLTPEDAKLWSEYAQNYAARFQKAIQDDISSENLNEELNDKSEKGSYIRK